MTDYTAHIQFAEGETITEERFFSLLLTIAADVAAQKIINGGLTNIEDATAYVKTHDAEITDWARRLITHPDTFAVLADALGAHLNN